ncbi:unnamed protein product, partial [Symbiodinium necroappetens]
KRSSRSGALLGAHALHGYEEVPQRRRIPRIHQAEWWRSQREHRLLDHQLHVPGQSGSFGRRPRSLRALLLRTIVNEGLHRPGDQRRRLGVPSRRDQPVLAGH